MIASVARKAIPRPVRVTLRKSGLVRWVLQRMYSGERRVTMPGTGFTLHYDGARLPGFAERIGTLELAERESIARLLAESEVREVWDVGANIGIWMLHMASSWPTAQITCFEPDADNLRWLRKNIDTNALDGRVRVRPVAISSEEGELTFHADKYSGKTGSLEDDGHFIEKHFNVKTQPVTVQTINLDSELGRAGAAPQMLKIDVEGHELELLRGATRLLAESRPVIMIEISRNHEEVIALIRGHGYEIFDQSLRPIEAAEFNTICVPKERPLAG